MSLTFYRCKIADYPDDTFGVKDPGHQRLVEMTIPRDSMGDYEKCSFYSYQTNRTILMFNSSDLQENFTIGVNATLQKCSKWVYEKSVFKETYTSKVFFNIWYTRWFYCLCICSHAWERRIHKIIIQNTLCSTTLFAMTPYWYHIPGWFSTSGCSSVTLCLGGHRIGRFMLPFLQIPNVGQSFQMGTLVERFFSNTHLSRFYGDIVFCLFKLLHSHWIHVFSNQFSQPLQWIIQKRRKYK